MAAENVVTQEQIDALAAAIKENVQIQGGGTDKFCAAWPDAKMALSALQGILALVPGVSAFAAPAIGVVIAAGTAASNSICPKK
ncbi:hypothetical protein AB4Z46_26495 [Variovorax sp. M-6]|uniref:hypothetical protein n=1 Tax=Variovorax sp. M-6 TaxID=3233041 RepID=UPI003F96DE2B